MSAYVMSIFSVLWLARAGHPPTMRTLPGASWPTHVACAVRVIRARPRWPKAGSRGRP